MENFKEYPKDIVQPLNEYEKANDEGAMHKSLLDLGESLLTYIVGVMFGEYKRSGNVSEILETEFYKYSSRKPSFGVFLSFMRILSKEMDKTILTDKFEKSKKYESASEFIFEFDLLKQVVNEGADEGFSDKLESLRKGRSAGQKGLMEFFDTFIMIRNTYAHPEDKAGPKDNKRKWPLTEEYYENINPHMHRALAEIIEDLEILKSYKPILAKKLDDQGKKGKFEVEIGIKGSELELKLSNEDLRFVSSDVRYLLDPNEKLFVKFYYSKIPQLNPEVAKKIIDKEKAKAMEPHMIEMIDSKLVDDGKIDDMEYLILRDTAKTSSISIEHLFKLIEKSKNKLQIKASVGTPDNKGDIFVEAKDEDNKFIFNPWWLHYFSMIPKIDKNTVKTEQANEKKAESQIKKLKDSKKVLPVSKRLENAKKNLKNKKAQKSKQLKSINAQIQKKRATRKKTKDPERKRELLANIEEMKSKGEEKKEDFDLQIVELLETIERIEIEKADKTNEIDEKILTLSNDLEEYSKFTQWGMHKNLWNEINQYVDHLLEVNLNDDVTIINEVEDDEDDERVPDWVNTQNQWQIGNLAYYYWAKIHRSEAPLGMTWHVGYCLAKKFPFLPKNIDESLIETSKKPASILWTTQDDQWAAKIDIDGAIGRKKAELNQNLLKDYESELLELGTNVRCTPKGAEGTDEDQHFMPAEKFLTLQDEYNLESLYSRLWPVDSYYKNGKILTHVISQYEKEMVTMLQLFSNVVIQLNDYALENGINQETIVERNDQFNRLKDIMFKEYEKDFPVGTLFRPSKAQNNNWREFATKELGLTGTRGDRLYDMISSNFRFGSGYATRKYLREQRDKFKPDSNEYKKWDKKIKEL